MSGIQTVYDTLNAASDVTDLTGTRIYAERGPDDGTVPVVIFERVSSPATADLSGEHFMNDVISVGCYAETVETVEALADAVRAALKSVSVVRSVSVIPFTPEEELFGRAVRVSVLP